MGMGGKMGKGKMGKGKRRGIEGLGDVEIGSAALRVFLGGMDEEGGRNGGNGRV